MTEVSAQPALEFKPASAHVPVVSSEDKLRLLIETGLLLASERSLDVIVQSALETGRKLCGAAFGLFLYVHLDETGLPCQMAAASGIDPARAATLAPLIDLAQLFAENQAANQTDSQVTGSHAQSVVRLADLDELPESQRPCIFTGLAPPLRSYLAVPVRCRSVDLVGALLFGHSDPNAFDRQDEDLVATIASQAAVAIDNFRLGGNLVHEVAIADGARSLQRETASRLRQALEAAQLGTFTWDRNTDLLDLDERAAQLLGLSRGERITRSDLRERILVPEDAPRTALKLEEAFGSGSNYYAEYRIETPAGEKVWIATSGIHTYAPGPQGSAPIVGMVGTVQDITGRRTQEHALRESEKLAATGRLAATIAHEINNPLEAITNLIYLARTDPGIPAPVQSLLETADAELARVAQIAQQTLGFYRDTARPVAVDVNELLRAIADLFKRKMRSKSLTCTFDLEPGACVFALQGEMRQVFSNLLVNAMDASQQSNIHIRTRIRRSFGTPSVTVLISDRGAGVPRFLRQRLFTPFVTSKESIGTGLGLWVTRGIVQKHGGFIDFRTRTEPPAGTLFRVVLPITPPSQLSSPACQLHLG
jgi:PAS domain S-box-containing protein